MFKVSEVTTVFLLLCLASLTLTTMNHLRGKSLDNVPFDDPPRSLMDKNDITPYVPSNPLWSNTSVVFLTEDNWDEIVLNSSVPVIVNICRSGCPACRSFHPHWERYAALPLIKGLTYAYFDINQLWKGGYRPKMLGSVLYTPTIRVYIPDETYESGIRTALYNLPHPKSETFYQWLVNALNGKYAETNSTLTKIESESNEAEVSTKT